VRQNTSYKCLIQLVLRGKAALSSNHAVVAINFEIHIFSTTLT